MLQPRQNSFQFEQASPRRSPRPSGNSRERNALLARYRETMLVNPELTRALVSFQANKSAPFYRWFKYKEAFSSEFVKYILSGLRPSNGKAPRLLDPFAGAGTTLTTATRFGWHTTGIELLPVGAAVIKARLKAETVSIGAFQTTLEKLRGFSTRHGAVPRYRYPHLRITEKAFTAETENEIGACDGFIERITDPDVQFLFRFAVLSVLEDVSYTRKDGQYLRWDHRSRKNSASDFHKGEIHKFWPAITKRLETMLEDLQKRDVGNFPSQVKLVNGSCLSELPELTSDSYDLILTSPPYCNRYDYTRTYALELAYLGYGEEAVKSLRQALLSATVENKSKRCQLSEIYRTRDCMARYDAIVGAFDNQEALREIMFLLNRAKNAERLNNNNIPAMVEQYFFEMNFVIHELARVLAPGGHLVMVNDNVQYAGEEIPVDLILSDFAVHAGLNVDHIWVLPRGKGNSSQQMDLHGRNEIRKCVYLWSKPAS